MTEQQLTPEVVASLVFGGVVALLFLEYARGTYIDWREQRDGHALRALILSVSIAASLTALFAARLFRAGILPLDLTAFVGYVVSGMLLVSGIVLVVSWHADRRAQRGRRIDDR